MTNEELVLRIQAGEDVALNTERLYLQNLGLIRKVARKYFGLEEREDLLQEGFFGICTASKLWREDGGASFATYVFPWLRVTLERYIDNSGSVLRLPVHRIERINKYKKVINLFLMELGREPTSQELAEALGITMDQVDQIREDAAAIRIRSMSEPVGISEDDDAELSDIIPDPENPFEAIEDRIQNEQLASLLWGIVDSLGGRESVVIRKRYQDSKTLREVGDDLGIAPERVRQIQASAIRKLRRSNVRRQLEPFYIDVVLTGYKAVGVGAFNRTRTSATERAVLQLEEIREMRRTDYQYRGDSRKNGLSESSK